MDASFPFPPALLYEVRHLAGNDRCAECGSVDASWASVSHGLVMCLQCAGKHRALGVHVSFVKNLTMDNWTVEQAKKMQLGGNAQLERFLARYGKEKLPVDRKYRAPEAEFYRTQLAEEAKRIVDKHGRKALTMKADSDGGRWKPSLAPGAPAPGAGAGAGPGPGGAGALKPVDVECEFGEGVMGFALVRAENLRGRVSRVTAHGNAEVGGVEVGDIVVKVNDAQVGGYDEVMDYVKRARRPVRVTFRRFVREAAPAPVAPEAEAEAEPAGEEGGPPSPAADAGPRNSNASVGAEEAGPAPRTARRRKKKKRDRKERKGLLDAFTRQMDAQLHLTHRVSPNTTAAAAAAADGATGATCALPPAALEGAPAAPRSIFDEDFVSFSDGSASSGESGSECGGGGGGDAVPRERLSDFVVEKRLSDSFFDEGLLSSPVAPSRDPERTLRRRERAERRAREEMVEALRRRAVVFGSGAMGMSVAVAVGSAGEAVVTVVKAGGQAARGGVLVGDVVREVNEEKVSDYAHLMRLLEAAPRPVHLSFSRPADAEAALRAAREADAAANGDRAALRLDGAASEAAIAQGRPREREKAAAPIAGGFGSAFAAEGEAEGGAAGGGRRLGEVLDGSEFDVVIGDGPLGLRLEERGGLRPVSVVTSVTKGLQCEKLGVRVGCTVVGINGEHFLGHAHAVATLKHGRRPIHVRFRHTDA